jgi:hypothetical protein
MPCSPKHPGLLLRVLLLGLLLLEPFLALQQH